MKKIFSGLMAIALTMMARGDFEVWFMSNGETTWDRDQRLQNSLTSSALTDIGIAATRETAAALKQKKIDFDYLYTSPLHCAKMTAKIIANSQEISLKPEDRLRETAVREQIRDFLDKELKPLDGNANRVL